MPEDHHVFERGCPPGVCDDTAAMLRETRHAPYSDVVATAPGATASSSFDRGPAGRAREPIGPEPPPAGGVVCAPRLPHLAAVPMPLLTVLGLAAGLLTSLAFLPQVLRTWRTRSAEDLSASTFSMFCVGVLLWLVYGILTRDLPIILANAATLVMAGAILSMKIAFSRRRVVRPEPPVDARS